MKLNYFRAPNRLIGAPYDWPLKWQYVLAIGLVVVSLALRWLLQDHFAGHASFLLLFSVLLPLALAVRPQPFVVSAVLGFLGVWLAFIPPQMSFAVSDGQEKLTLWIFGATLGATTLTALLSRRALHLRERNQEALLETARHQQLLSDAAPALISYVDRHLRYRLINKAYSSWFGQAQEALRGMHVRDLLGEAAFKKLQPYVDAVLRGEHVEFEHEIPYERGGKRYVRAYYVPDVDSKGTVAGFFALVTDISDRKRMEDELRLRSEQFEKLFRERKESEERFRNMADNAPVLIWVADTSGERTYFNRQWLKFTGRAPATELNSGWIEGIHADDLEACLAICHRAFENQENFRMEYRLRREDGQYRWLVDEGVPRHLADGTFAGYIGSCIDITERKRSEVALRETDRRKDEFLATLAHELRNPLAAISTATTVLGSTRQDADRVGEMAAIIDRQSSQLVRLINDLLDVSRISRGKVKLERRRVDLTAIVREVAEDLRSACVEGGLALELALPADPIVVSADRVRLSQVVNNLLENACKFTPRGGTIRIAIEREEDQAVVRVTDTGIGMAQEQLARIFDMFTQAEELPSQRSGGLGIGLSLARSLIELHSGRIEATSAGRGRGSEFLVRLRIADTRQPDISADASSDSAPPGRIAPLRIVAADDNRDSLQAIALLLRMKGHEVETADDGVEALRKVQTYRPDVALLDIGMPGMDGYEVARRIRQENWGRVMLLVAMTGWGQNRDKQQAAEAGFDAHLTKPADLEVLDRLLESQKPADPVATAFLN